MWNATADLLTSGDLQGIILKAKLVNDFIGVGLGLTVLDPGDIEVIHEAPRVAHAPIACVGAGTGLGEVYLTWNDSTQQYFAWPSEGGMTEFNAQNEDEWQLRQYLHRRDGHVTVEGVVSGPGLVSVYQFLSSQTVHDRDSHVIQRLIL